jgi:PEP-CTERM motif
MKRNYLIYLAIFILLGMATSSNAMNLTFDNPGSFEFGGIGFGDYTVQQLSKSFNLDEGKKSGTLDFFNVSINSPIAAGIGKAIFNIGPLNDEGVYAGLSFGRYTIGAISWGAPQIIAYNGGSLELDLFDVKNFGAGSSFNISGTMKYTKDSISVPEPGAMLSLGIVLLGLVAVSRKRFNERN